MGMEMMEIETDQPTTVAGVALQELTVEELEVKVGNLTTCLRRRHRRMLLDTVRKIADQAKETFGSQSNYPGFVQEVYEVINYPVDNKWLEWASVARDVDVELEYEVSVSGYVSVSGAYVDVDGGLDNVTVTATLKDVPGEITDVSDIEDVSDYSEFEQDYEFSEGQLSVELTLVGISER